MKQFNPRQTNIIYGNYNVMCLQPCVLPVPSKEAALYLSRGSPNVSSVRSSVKNASRVRELWCTPTQRLLIRWIRVLPGNRAFIISVIHSPNKLPTTPDYIQEMEKKTMMEVIGSSELLKGPLPRATKFKLHRISCPQTDTKDVLLQPLPYTCCWTSWHRFVPI